MKPRKLRNVAFGINVEIFRSIGQELDHTPYLLGLPINTVYGAIVLSGEKFISLNSKKSSNYGPHHTVFIAKLSHLAAYSKLNYEPIYQNLLVIV
jgi:hypothetical protein